MHAQTRELIRLLVLWGGLTITATPNCFGDEPVAKSVRYVSLENIIEPTAAVIVTGQPLAHTAQLMAESSDERLKSLSVEEQAQRVLQNLDLALQLQNTRLTSVVKLNVYVSSPQVTSVVRRVVAGRFAGEHVPAMSFVQSRLPLPHAEVAADAVAIASSHADSTIRRSNMLSGHQQIEHIKILPVGPRAYISGQAERGSNLSDATQKTLTSLQNTLKFLGADKRDVVQVKCFLTPMSDVRAAEAAIVNFFGETAPPCVFVEWQSSLPNEIELITAVPSHTTPQPSSAREGLEFLTPPGMTASPVFCRVVRINGPRTIFVSGLIARKSADGTGQVMDVFDQLKSILAACDSDLRHLAKATYYISDNDVSMKLNELRPKFYDATRPPAASKAQVFGIGIEARSLAIDMIAVPAQR